MKASTLCLLALGTSACADDFDAAPYCGDAVVDRELGEECDDGNELTGDGCAYTCQLEVPVRVSWRLLSHDGGPASCPPVLDTADVLSNGDVGYFDRFECAQGSAVVMRVPGTYDTALALGDGGERTLGTSLPATQQLDETHPVELTMIADGGYLELAPGIFDAASGEILGCTEAGGTSLTLTLEQAGAPALVRQLPCSGLAEAVLSSPLPAGAYRATVEAAGATGTFDELRIGYFSEVTSKTLLMSR